jgi:Leucine-rich repeat (LRR) protein
MRIISLDLFDKGLSGALDLTGLDALTELDCDFNNITALNVSGLDGLEILRCSSNPLLTTLNITGCTALTKLDVAFAPLLAMPAFPDTLEHLDCRSNGLTELIVTSPALWFLDCSENKLTVLDVSGLTALEHLDCSFNRLTGLDLTGLTQLDTLICNNNRMTGEGDLIGLDPGVDLTFAPQVISVSEIPLTVPKAGASPVTATETSQYTCTVTWPGVSGTFGYGTEYTANIAIYPKAGFTLMGVPSGFFTVEGALTVTFTSGNLAVAKFPATVSYHAGDMAVINEIIKNNGLKWTEASQTQLTDGRSVPASWTGATWKDDGTNMRIAALQISDKGLSGALNVTGLTKLETLYCHNNPELTSLNASGCAVLTDLGCAYSALTSLNVSGCAALEEIDCTHNVLTSLNVSNLTALTVLDCYINEIAALNVSGCAALEEIDCSQNKLTSLNLTGLTALSFLDCSENFLSDKSKVIGFTGTWDDANFIFGTQNSLPSDGLDIMLILAIVVVAAIVIAAVVYVFVIRPKK